MILLGALGWGLIAVGAITHLWHRDRLHELLAMHTDRAGGAAGLLITAELTIALAAAIGVVLGASWLPVVALGGALLGLVFCAWIARLLISASELPCACSFSEAPTSGWSLLRAAAVVTIAALALVEADLGADERVGALVVGLAAAVAIHVVPESQAWPAATRAQLARLESHTPATAERLMNP